MIKRLAASIKNIYGFSITEVLFVLIISTAVVGTIVSIWMFSNTVWMQKSEQTMLRIDLMQAIEVMKKDIRLSSFTDMVFYPDGASVYTGISMPVADTDVNGVYNFNSEGEISWDRTVIYHIFTDASGHKSLRRTVYDPRNNTLTDVERYAQLESVVTNGTGGTGSETETDFLSDLDTFEVSPLSSVFDFYDESSDPIRAGKVVFGWTELDPGDHVIRFEVTGKNSSSSGYDIGVDSLMIEPCGSIREMEYYDSSYAPSGSISVNGGFVSLVNDDVWGNDNYLEFTTSGPGDYIEITDYYDLWRESSFEEDSLSNAETIDSEIRVALSVPEDDDEGEYAWFAYISTADTIQEGRNALFNSVESQPDIDEIVMRILIRNSETSMSEQEIDPDRALVRIRLKAGIILPVTINRAYITKKDTSSTYDGLSNITPTSPYVPSDFHMHQQLFFRDTSGNVTPGVTINANSEVFSLWSAFPFHTDDDYLVTLHIGNASTLSSKYWRDISAGASAKTYYAVRKDIDCTVLGNVFTASMHGLSDGQAVSFDCSASTDFFGHMAGTPNWNSWNSSLPNAYTVELIDSDSFRLIESGGGYYTPSSGTHTVSTWEGIYSSPNIYFLANIDTWDVSGFIESKIADTTISSPTYNELSYSENKPADTAISFKARSSSSNTMTGATDWDLISGSTANPYGLSIGSGRYVQFRGDFSTTPYWEEENSGQQLTYNRYIEIQKINTDSGMPYRFPGYPAYSDNYYITKLQQPWADDIAIDWPGDSRICS